MKIRSPRDGFVASLALPDGSSVTAGQLVASIEPADELFALARAQSYAQSTELSGRMLAAPIADLTRQLMVAQLDLALETQKNLTPVMHQVVQRELGGLATVGTHFPLSAQIAAAKADEIEARQALADFDLKNKLFAEIHAYAAEHAKLEIEFAQRAVKKLGLVAPRAGHVRYTVATGVSVAQGDEVARIDP